MSEVPKNVRRLAERIANKKNSRKVLAALIAYLESNPIDRRTATNGRK